MRKTTRRAVLAGMGGLGLAGAMTHRPVQAASQLASAYRPPILKFRVEREGNPIGVVMERFQVEGDTLRVDVFIEFAVKLAFITVYRYEHRSREIWKGGRLVRIDTVTNDDGDAQAVNGAADGDRFKATGIFGPVEAPANILPSSYWHPDFVDQTRMLDSQKGRIMEFAITDEGSQQIEVQNARQVAATRYAMRGDVDLDFWYDSE